MAILVGSTVVSGIVAADPPRPGTEENGLSENESATLWSRDTDDYVSQEEYRTWFGDNRSAVQQVANRTDITFKRPPATAETWTRNDFEDLAVGGPETAVHPPHATLENSTFIKDAHATIFSVHPSTKGHLKPGRTPHYVAPNGTLRGLVDYRVRVPEGNSSENRTIEWSLAKSTVENVRLKLDEETLVTKNGTHTPALDYRIDEDWRGNLTLEADIQVQLRQTIRLDGGNKTDVNVSYRAESLTVADTLEVEVYHLFATPSYAEYPNGDQGVSLFQSRPWQGFTLTENGTARVRGVWRFYTARNTDWDTLLRSNRTDTTTVESDAIPVYVHAYPSHIGPRAEPVRDGPEIIDTWGTNRSAPDRTIGENINIDIVNQSYTATHGLAIRAETVDYDTLRVRGIVRGVNTSVAAPTNRTERPLRRSNLSVEIVQQNQSRAMLRIELRDAQTGDPIALTADRFHPVGGNNRTGYITVADQRVRTNASGVATVTLDELGIYTVRYHPGSWLSHNPAYTGETATVRWHPLGTIEGWFALIFEVGWQLLPFFVMFYAGKRLLKLLRPEDSFQ